MEGDSDEKIDSMQLEYTYLLTSQLDTQREFYEEKLARLESQIDAEAKQFKSKIDSIVGDFTKMEIDYSIIKKDKSALEKKLQHLTTKWVRK